MEEETNRTSMPNPQAASVICYTQQGVKGIDGKGKLRSSSALSTPRSEIRGRPRPDHTPFATTTTSATATQLPCTCLPGWCRDAVAWRRQWLRTVEFSFLGGFFLGFFSFFPSGCASFVCGISIFRPRETRGHVGITRQVLDSPQSREREIDKTLPNAAPALIAYLHLKGSLVLIPYIS